MTRLPWQHSRSRTKSGGEKTNLSTPQEWFSRHTTEPSRQALSDLLKAHKREKSEEHSSGRSRSRANTITSTDWQQHGSRSGSISEESLLRPTSPLQTGDGTIYFAQERPEGNSKNIFAKGGLLLRRTGSKMSLSSAGSGPTHTVTSPPRNPSASNTARGEDIRSKISAPFDFQHVTHTEQTQFKGLSRIAESELANQFSAVLTRQSAAPGIRGIEVSDIASQEPVQVLPTTAPTLGKVLEAPLPELPQSPDGPTPPPKHQSIGAYTPPRPASPTSPWFPHETSPSSPKPPPSLNPTSTEASPSPTDPCGQNGSTELADGAILDSKPLPELPVIHAVTTADNTARAMIAAPLPTPPGGGVSPAPEGGAATNRVSHQRQKSSFALPRHFSLRPSAKTSMPNLLSADYLATEAKVLARHHSDVALSQQLKDSQARCDSRVSTSFAAVDTMNWEDAVDEAWDEADDESLAMRLSQTSSSESRKASSVNLLDSFPSEEGRSNVSTPLMMAPTHPLPPIPSDKTVPPVSVEVHKLQSVQEDEQQNDLTGLGISSCPPSGMSPNTVHLSRSSSLHYSKRRSSMYTRQSETLTRSSSQESIILSIASSIIGTQRSSNSSLNPEEILYTHKIEEETVSEVDEAEPKAVSRPESGCLPSNVMEQMSKAGLASALNGVSEDELTPPIPPVPQHKHSKSASRIPVPERRSSVAAPDTNRTIRKRSNTTGTRRRQSARISYSLFPTATPVPRPSTVTS